MPVPLDLSSHGSGSHHSGRNEFQHTRHDLHVEDRAPDLVNDSLGNKFQSPLESFIHEALDLEDEQIRLIRILPSRSHEGLVQCQIETSSTNEEYICLSWVWGNTTDRTAILINGMVVMTQKNLLDFLKRASQRTRLTSTRFWIDALCIDQNNVKERNHQVQHMGQIYSRAREVISWLGEDEDIATYLTSFKNDRQLFAQMGRTENVSLATKFNQSDYWKRAWITQEVVLARSVTLMAQESELPLDRIRQRMWSTSGARFSHSITFDQFNNLIGKSLIYILQRCHMKQCTVPYDRVYSLLGLCGEGADLEVDYHVPRHKLIQRILVRCQSSLCLCSAAFVHRAICGDEPYSLELPIPRSQLMQVELQLFSCPDKDRLREALVYAEIIMLLNGVGLPLEVKTPDDWIAQYVADLSVLCPAMAGRITVYVYEKSPRVIRGVIDISEPQMKENVPNFDNQSLASVALKEDLLFINNGKSCLLRLTCLQVAYLSDRYMIDRSLCKRVMEVQSGQEEVLKRPRYLKLV